MHIHILGIAGSKTAPLAKILQSQGHLVTGSDQEKIYPPVSTILAHAQILLNQTPVTHDIDLVIVGNSYQSFANSKSEFEQIKSLSIPYVSYTEYLVKNLIKPNSILVAGSYGKTTITSLLCHVFLELGLDPSYMFGGEPLNGFDSTRFGQSNWSIVEADENKNGLDTDTTFLYYPVKYLILTSTQWEHKESYGSAADNLDAFKKLIAKLPADGLLIYNPSDPEIAKIIQYCPCPAFAYPANSNLNTQLIGAHNQQNISAVFTLCQKLGLPEDKVSAAIASFQGVKRRLQVLSTKNDFIVIDDFAQSGVRVKSAVDAIKFSFPQKNIRVFFEPHASFLQDKSSLNGFREAFDSVSEVILGKINFSDKVAKENRTSARDWLDVVGQKLTYQPINSEIVQHFSRSLKPSDILVHFSSGGLDGLQSLDAIIANLQSKTL